MGKKTKVGKARKDKFYELAKTEGYRSRAAYKLLQLDGKFNFLSRATICLDLCAAPGGWLQAAQKRMPVSSIIVGVDLHKIRPIPNVLTFVEDITTAKCRQTIKGVFHDRKANVVLHDGAPNVGKSWIHDAYQQAVLTLSALKLATVFLDRGGYFVTKVFRSKDYNALLWVFNQMFKKIHSTKPQASRNESAEIFVICEGFLAPDNIDPKFFDPKSVFKDVEADSKAMLNLFHPEKQNKKPEGYADGEVVVEHKLSALKFITGENYLELLQNATEIILDDERIINHKSTTDELKECIKDLQVLGKKDIRHVLKWQKQVKKFLAETDPSLKKTLDDAKDGSDEEPEDEDEAELRKTDELISQQKDELEKDKKKKKKEMLKEKRKYQRKVDLKMVVPGDQIIAVDDIELFNLKNIKSQQQQEKIADVSDREEVSDDSDIEEMDADEDDKDNYYENLAQEQPSESKRESKHAKRKRLRENKNEDFEVVPEPCNSGVNDEDSDSDDSDDSEDSDDCGDDFVEDLVRNNVTATNQKKRKNDDFEVVPTEPNLKKVKLNPYELAVGEEVIKSQKRRRELVEMSYHRYVNNDTDLPEWFTKEERMHCRKQTPVTKEQIQMYKERQKAIDAQPLKKVAQAQARKKRKLENRLEKARKKSEAITDSIEMSEREKLKAAKEIYKKAGLLKTKKRNLTYVVAKKHTSQKRATRPSGVKGSYRIVDPRMKKDQKLKKMAAKGKKGKGGKKSMGGKKPMGGRKRN